MSELLPTPVANDSGMSVEYWDRWVAKLKAKRINGNGHGRSLAIEVQRGQDAWAKYEPAVTRWAEFTRPAPPRCAPNRNGDNRLSPAFSEWMQGLPAGWVSGIEGISKRDTARMIGNTVVPQQAAHALRLLLDDVEAVL